MEEEKILESLGFSKNEARTYITLLKLGSVPAGPLIKELGMHRAAVYDLLDILISKGLVHYVVQANRKYFEAQDPERLLEMINQERQKLDKREDLLKEHVSELKSLRKISKEKQEGTIYKGKKGLKSIFEDMLKYPNKEFLVMGASGKFKEIFNMYFIHWQKRRVKAKIRLKIIYSESIRGERRRGKLKLSEIRYTDNTNITPSTTFIYGDKIAIIMWSDAPLAFLMRTQNVSDSYRNFFNIMWKNSKK